LLSDVQITLRVFSALYGRSVHWLRSAAFRG